MSQFGNSSAIFAPDSIGLRPYGFLGVFGTRRFAVFFTPGTYAFTASYTGRHRVRVVGGGGGGARGDTSANGSDGGQSSFGSKILA